MSRVPFASMSATSTSPAHRAFSERLAARPLLMDGAMGTLLFSRGIPQRASLDELVESHPDVVSAVHREYVAAGADIIETDTFGANRLRLAPYGLGPRAGRFNRRAAQLAREARDVAGRDVLVAGSVGPLAGPMRPERPNASTMRAAVREQVEGLLGVRLFDRHGKSVAPTVYGSIVSETARRILGQLDALPGEIEQVAGLDTGRLAVGAGPYVVEVCLGAAAGRLLKRHPGTRRHDDD